MVVRHLRFARPAAIVLLLIAFFCTGAVYSEDESRPVKTIRYKAEADYPPYKFYDGTMLTGFDIEFTRMMFLEPEYDVIFSVDSWPAVYDDLKSGRIDTCGMLVMTEDRKKDLLFSRPVFKSSIGVFAKKDGPVGEIRNLKLEDLKKFRVGTGAEQFAEAVLSDRLGIAPFKSYETVADELSALQAGQVDLIFESQDVVNYLLIKKNLTGSIGPRITNLFPVDVAYGVRKDYPELVEYINGKITALMDSGVYDGLYQQYFLKHSDSYYYMQRNNIILAAVILALATGAVILFLQLYIRRLRRKLTLEQGFSNGIVDNANIMVAVARTDGTAIMFNKYAEDITGYKAKEVVGRPLSETIIPGWNNEEASARNMENHIRRSDGSRIDILWNITVLHDAGGKPVHIVAMGTDITERKRMELMLRDSYQELEATHEELVASEEELKQQYNDLHEREEELSTSEERYRLAVEGVNDGIWDWDARNGKLFMSKRCRSMLGYDSDKEASTIEIWRDFIHEDDVEKFLRTFNSYLADPQKRYLNIEYRTRVRDGKSKWIRTRGKAIRDDEGRAVRLAGSNTDITEYKLYEEKIHQLAYYDSLTGLPNRMLLADRFTMAAANAQRKDRMVAIYFFDLDQFKSINDTLGHTYGDELLSMVGGHLKMHLRKGDTIARLGGDEFIMMQANIKDIDEVRHMAARVLEMFQRPWILEGHEFYVTASIGISIYPNDGADLPALMKNADAAMYRAKEMGRNNFQLFTSELNSRILERLAIENNLRKAIDRDEMEILYQPQVELATGRVKSVEALLRWRHPELGTLLPEKFIPLAEESGLIVSIGEWVLRSACRQIVQWHAEGLDDLRVAVNLLPRQFQQGNLPAVMSAIMEETGVSPEWLELEITESIALKDLSNATSILEDFRKMGMRISLDDFGTGYSSLNHLKRLPIDNLKMDRSLVDGLTRGSNEALIAKALISLAHGMKLLVTAEGVETEKQLEILRDEKCDIVQGFLLSEPKPVDELDLMVCRS